MVRSFQSCRPCIRVRGRYHFNFDRRVYSGLGSRHHSARNASTHLSPAYAFIFIAYMIASLLGSVLAIIGTIGMGLTLSSSLVFGQKFLAHLFVDIGIRFIASVECNAHDVYKRKVLEAQEEDTVRTTLFGNGWPSAWHRTLRTDFVRQWLPREQRVGFRRLAMLRATSSQWTSWLGSLWASFMESNQLLILSGRWFKTPQRSCGMQPD
jgi:hypothetical protein